MAIQAAFTLTANEIYDTLANMIISQEVFADNIGEHQTLVDQARVDGGLYGDTKLYYATDVLKSHDWLNDLEASNLLAIERAKDPLVQAIKLDKFRQIRLTLDNYLTKKAWSNEGAFGQFNSVMLGWMRDTKRAYDGTLYNVFIGTTSTNVGKQTREIDLAGARASASTEEEANRLEASALVTDLANLMVEMSDYSRDFNDYKYFRSFAKDSVKFILNAEFVNKVKYTDLVTIFHNAGLEGKLSTEVLPARYFGRAVAAGDKGSGKAIGTDGTYDNTKGVILRSKVEKDIGLGSGKASAVADVDGVAVPTQHVFPGDLIPNGVTVKQSGDFEEDEVYVEDASIIGKVLVKLPPYMSAFEVGTTFFNPRSLTENHYITYGTNTLAYLKNYPFITLVSKAE